jgi:hypothetical protein
MERAVDYAGFREKIARLSENPDSNSLSPRIGSPRKTWSCRRMSSESIRKVSCAGPVA